MTSVKLTSTVCCFVSIALALFAMSSAGGEKPIVVPEMDGVEDRQPLISFSELPEGSLVKVHYQPGQQLEMIKEHNFGGEKQMNLQLLLENPIAAQFLAKDRREKKWSRFEPSIRFY